jgi:hypothetical protein
LAQVVQQELQVAAEQMAGNQFLVAQRLLVEIVELATQLARVELQLMVQVQAYQVLRVRVGEEVLSPVQDQSQGLPAL